MSGLLVIGGPTASGKTDAAIAVAERFGARIVSADAMMVYRGFDVGTAKPEPAILQRTPHELVDIREGWEDYSAADFAADADRLIAEHPRVVVVGGTGFYLRSLLVGLAPAPPADPDLRRELEALENPHAALAAVDPALAARLHPNDRVRVIRALEVFRLTGRPFSEIHAEHAFSAPRHAAVRVALDRADLTERIDRRVLEMMDRGYLEEVRGLLARGLTPEHKPMRSLGYKWLTEHLLQGLDLEEAVRRTQRDTRTYARKQRLMLRSVGGFLPLDGADLDGVLRAAEEAFSSGTD